MTSKARRPSASTQDRKFYRSRCQWRDKILGDPELPCSVKVVATFLADNFNQKYGGTAWPSLETIVAAVALSKHTVIDGVRSLEARGYLAIEPGKAGRGHSNHYKMAAE